MNRKLIKTWSLRVLVAWLLLSAASLFWVNNELRYMYGANTPVIDHNQFQSPQQLTVIQNVSVLATDGLSMLAGQTVLIDQGQIAAIGSNIEIPSGAAMLDGSGKYLIPGLIDSHVHLWESENDLLLYLANGITHIREMTGTSDHLAWREEIDNGRMGPSLFVTSPKLVTHGFFEGWFHALTRASVNIQQPSDVASTLESLRDKGYDAYKLGTMLTPENYRAINTNASDIGVPAIGHFPISMSLDELATTEQAELAHIEELMKPLMREFGSLRNQRSDEFLAYVESRSEQLIDDLLASDIAVTSTLIINESFYTQKFDLDAMLAEQPIEYVNPGVLEGSTMAGRGWLQGNNLYQLAPDTDPNDIPFIKQYWKTYATAQHILLKAMAKRGVKIMAGTDANVPVVVPGFSLHQELIALTKAGLSPAQSLLSATAVPADFMNSHAGRVAEGYRADLLLLNKNPLQDIKNTQTIDTVISNGRVVSRRQLDAMLDAIRQVNDDNRKIDIK
ncbi:amidohydrolase family protein [Arenicella xantha]|uniref:Amidohydrolase family protein n=1 Tax=Arenicella xantha TaxID=644221 RepID=A0A395JIK2_9GAMM|nr:amidohydrolase family protein [Arenicella xantha]RBP48585.1 amidohydrolase family protein [Arenicella xantha]